MKHATPLIAGIAASLLAFGAYAGDYAQKPSFQSLDTDGDGRISATEAASHSKLSAKMAERGTVSLSETEFDAIMSADESRPTRTAESDGQERTTDTDQERTTGPDKQSTTGTEDAPTVAPTPPTQQ